ncbi:MAG: acetylglutamate kinase [Flavisolibacter sp.]|nr:acetylglutamate kinase [Flavisolibacter sp.]
MDNMYYGAGPLIFQRAEELRNTMTSAEKIIWKHIHINEWKLKFRRQHPISNYIVDFYCHQLKLVIEIDGDIHDLEEVKRNDKEREEALKSLGLHIIRFKNEEVYKKANAVLQKIDETIQQLQRSSRENKKPLYVVKIGGNIIDDDSKLKSFLKSFATIITPLQGMGVLIHGGGKLATRLAEQMNVPQQMVDGRRITDAETLKIATMVYAGYINKNIVAQLQANGCNAVGVSGADGNAILAHKRVHATINYGFAGDIDEVNASFFQNLLQQNLTPVIAPITHDQKGQLLNTNADTIAQETAKALSSFYDVQLIYSFEKDGVLLDVNDAASVIKKINADYYKELKTEGKIFAGMIPKLDNAFTALNSGVKKVIIGKAEEIGQLIQGEKGTSITNE